MRWLVLALVPVAFAVSLPLTWLMVRLGHKLETFDSPGVAGQVKAPRRRIPNTGGVAIFWAIAFPMLAGLAILIPIRALMPPYGRQESRPEEIPAALWEHIPGIAAQAPTAFLLLACMAVLHTLGLIDDRRPLGPGVKLLVMIAAAVAVPTISQETRLLTLLNVHVGGPWLSILITAAWFIAVTNAMNFLDDMDGLSAGVAAVAGGCFLAATMLSGQWFVGSCLALLIGACLGFLVFNFPREGGAKIFMGRL